MRRHAPTLQQQLDTFTREMRRFRTELDAALAKVAGLGDLLLSVEWGQLKDRCPRCGGAKERAGHVQGCPLKRAADEARDAARRR